MAGTSKAAELVEQAVNETLTYYAFPNIHWQKIRTNNPLERIMREIRRRTFMPMTVHPPLYSHTFLQKEASTS
jgi:transposase-like protein